MAMKVGSTGGTGVRPPRDPEEMTATERGNILKLIKDEKKSQGPSKGRPTKPGTKPGGNPVVARYIAPGPGIVPKYMVVPPWAGIDAHQAVVNKIMKDGKVDKKEASLVRKLFNRDISEAKKDGHDIRKQVARYLDKVFGKVKMDAGAHALIFGRGGPGWDPNQMIAMYIVHRPIN
jgi:hypothetical protein